MTPPACGGVSRWLSAILSLAAAEAVGGHSSEGGGNAPVVLAKHSFQGRLNFDNGLRYWLSSGATMALRDRVQLMPPVPDRFGIFWHTKAIKTEFFDVVVQFQSKIGSSNDRDGAFALWLSPQNFADEFDEKAIVTRMKVNWTEAMQQSGRTFLGNRPDFKGLVCIFLPGDASNKRDRVASLWHDGSTKLSIEDIKQGKGATLTEVDWLASSNATVRVVTTGAPSRRINISLTAGKETKMLFDMTPEAALGKEMFMGFTGYSGSSNFLQVDLNSVETRALDPSQLGEDVDDVVKDAAAWAEVFAAEMRFVNQASQKEAILRLTTLLGKYVDDYSATGKEIQARTNELESRLSALGRELGNLVAATEAFDYKKGIFDSKSVLNHISEVHTILHSSKTAHDAKLNEVNTAAKNLKEASGPEKQQAKVERVLGVKQQAEILEEHVSKGSWQSSMMLLVLVLCVAGLGLLFLKRMRYYEKKHYI